MWLGRADRNRRLREALIATTIAQTDQNDRSVSKYLPDMPENPCLVALPPPHLVHPHRVFESTQLGVAAIVEKELLASHQLAHDV